MPFPLTFHYDNRLGFVQPFLFVEFAGAPPSEFARTGADAFGPIYQLQMPRLDFRFKFKDGPGNTSVWEGPGLDRPFRPYQGTAGTVLLDEVWCSAENAFIYPVPPKPPEQQTAAAFLQGLVFPAQLYAPGTGGFSGLGANVLADGRMLFGLYHPNAARVYLMGSFNDWQRPGADNPDPTKFIELDRYRGYFAVPNTWLVITDVAKPGDEYKFAVFGGVPSDDKHRLQQYYTDPYARQLGPDFGLNNAMVIDPTVFRWHDEGWSTPDISSLIVYELSVYGFTETNPDMPLRLRGRFAGITDRIRSGYFDQLGITVLALMPLTESPSMQGFNTLGYDPSLYFTVERDFGSPDDLRELVDTAHAHNLAVILDQVFNHTSSSFNPLWKLILEHPDEEFRPEEGGLYFNGSTPWGNRIDSSKLDVQNMLIDACKLLIQEYHVDGFRFDATHHDDYMDFRLLARLADEVRGFKPDAILIAENLPNQADLNRRGFDGFAQWCDPFHDKVKALLREGPFQGSQYYDTNLIGDIFFFSKSIFAAHTNNVVNYCESHDETSPSFEAGTNPVLDNSAAKDRKGRLGLLATMVAMGQPMVYMGQEFNVERDRNTVRFDWPSPFTSSGFWQWARRVIKLRRRYPGLKLRGYNPEAEGTFTWIVAPWMSPQRGGGRKVIGWRARPSPLAFETMVVLLNFEGFDVQVDLDLGIPGAWVKLADVERANDIPPEGTNSVAGPGTLRTADGRFDGFTLPSSSGFIYKWEASN